MHGHGEEASNGTEGIGEVVAALQVVLVACVIY